MLELALTAIVWFMLGWAIRDLGPSLLTLLKKYKNGELAISRRADPSVICKKHHSWIKAYQNGEDGNAHSRNICQVCGLVQGTDRVLSPKAIDRVEEINRALSVENKLFEEFIEMENKEINRFFAHEIASGVSVKKLHELHTYASTFEERFSSYKVMKKFQIEQELQKSNA